jgi:glyoxylase-like metal-dependent hydrolase (beta-lactamase superfamily II)
VPAVTLLQALGDQRPRALLLTHVHFDHAGASGSLVRRWSEIEAWGGEQFRSEDRGSRQGPSWERRRPAAAVLMLGWRPISPRSRAAPSQAHLEHPVGLHASEPRYRAEDLIYEAWEAAGPRRAVFARKALALWPDCADGYVLLAQAASSLEEARVCGGRR